MYDPAILPSGHRYELTDIIRWLAAEGTDPQTREQFDFVQPLLCDTELQEKIQRWRAQSIAYHTARSRELEETDPAGAVRHLSLALEADPRSSRLLSDLRKLHVKQNDENALMAVDARCQG